MHEIDQEFDCTYLGRKEPQGEEEVNYYRSSALFRWTQLFPPTRQTHVLISAKVDDD